MADQSVHVTGATKKLIDAARTIRGVPIDRRLWRPGTLRELLDMRATASPEAPFLTYWDEAGPTYSYTYAQFRREVLQIAAWMHVDLGICPGERIATLMHNDPRTVLAYFAAWVLGVCVVPINSGEDDERIAFILENSEAKTLFVLSEYLDRARLAACTLAGQPTLVQVGGEPESDCLHWETALSANWPTDRLPELGLENECLIVYTSGTTGPPKGVMLEQYNLLADAQSIAEWHRFGAADRAMCVLPIHHVNGIVVTLVNPMVHGGSVVLHRKFSTQTFWRALAQEKCTYVSVVPTLLAFLCERAEPLAGYDLSAFRHFICGAGPLTVDLAKSFDEQFGLRVVHGYGLSETTCYNCYLPVDLPAAEYRHWMLECGYPSIGCPISVNEMAIHDGSGVDQPADVRGEIVVRGHCVMKYYFKRPEANADAFAHGWFRTGDEGFWKPGPDRMAAFFITGRLKELIIRGGVNYSPFDIDEVLNAIPGVRSAMAVGFDNAIYGEEIGAYVVLESGAMLTNHEIIAACRLELPYSKCPKVVVFGTEFPVTSTGKYQRNKLKPLFAEWRDAQFREQRQPQAPT